VRWWSRLGRWPPAICWRVLLVLLPFALLVALVEWQRQIQIGASLLVIGFGNLPARRSPPPTGIGADSGRRNWVFGPSPWRIAHGAGLMLVPIYLGLCREADLDKGHVAAGALINASLGIAVLVATVHAAADDRRRRMHGVAGLPLSRPEVRLSRSWFNLDTSLGRQALFWWGLLRWCSISQGFSCGNRVSLQHDGNGSQPMTALGKLCRH